MFYHSIQYKPHQEELEKILEKIVEAVQPERIYLKGRSFFIVLSSASQKSFALCRSCIEALGIQADYHYSFINSCQAEDYLLQGHFFYSSLFIKENLVYENGGSTLPLPVVRRMEVMKFQALSAFRHGYHRACWFLKGAGYFVSNRELGLGAFMLHQSAEQALRTMVQVIKGEDVRTHSLSELKQHLKKYAFTSELLAGSTDRNQYLLDRLEKAYSSSRYSCCYCIDEETVRELLLQVRRLLEDLKQMFGELLEQYSGSELYSFK